MAGAASCCLSHVSSPRYSATLAPCVPAQQLSCLILPAAEAGLPGLQLQQPGVLAVQAPLRAGELLAARAQDVVRQEPLLLHLSVWGKGGE